MGRFAKLLGEQDVTTSSSGGGRFAHFLEEDDDQGITYKGIVGFDRQGRPVGAKPIKGGKPAYAKRENPLQDRPVSELVSRAGGGVLATVGAATQVAEAVHRPDEDAEGLRGLVKEGLKRDLAFLIPRPSQEALDRSQEYIDLYERHQGDNLRNLMDLRANNPAASGIAGQLSMMSPAPMRPALGFLSDVLGEGMGPATATALDFLMESPDLLIPAKGVERAGRAVIDGLAPKLSRELLQEAFTEGAELGIKEMTPQFAREAISESRDPLVNAMRHAGSDVSPEAINRVARRERYVRISPGGEVTPIINDVSAADVRVRPGEAKVRIAPNGTYDLEQGRLNPAQATALRKAISEPMELRQVARQVDEVVDLTGEEDRSVLELLGVQVMDEPRPSAAQNGRQIFEEAAAPPPPSGGTPRASRPPQRPLPKLRDPMGRLRAWAADNLLPDQAGRGGFASAAHRFVAPDLNQTILKWLPRQIEGFEGARDAIRQLAHGVDQEMRSSVSAYRKSLPGGQRPSTREIYSMMDRARRKGDLSSLPEPLIPVAQRASDFIDDLSKKYRGIVPKETWQKFKDNLGSYLYRSYDTHSVRGFAEEIKGTDAWNNAYAFIKSQNDELSDEEIVGLMYSIADNDQDAIRKFGSRSGIGMGKAKELIRRKDIPDPIRGLMGEAEDIRKNFALSVENMSETLALYDMHRAIYERGIAEGWLRRAPEGRVGDVGAFHRRFNFSRPSPLNDTYTIPELHSLLNGVDEQVKLGRMARFGGAVKFGKTVLSPQTQARNFESGVLMSMANGRLHMVEGAIGGAAGFYGADQAEGSTATKFLATLAGFVGGSALGMGRTGGRRNMRTAGRVARHVVASGDRQSLKLMGEAKIGEIEGIVADLTKRGVIGRGGATADVLEYRRAIGGKRNRVLDFATRLYRTGDDFWKVFNYSEELDQLRKINEANPTVFKKTDEALKDEAAEIVSQQLQTYSRAPAIAKKLTLNPLVGNFVTFHMEMPRNLINISKRTVHELGLARKTGNPLYAKAAAKRIVGMASALSIWGAASKWQSYRTGVSPDQMEAARNLEAAPWEENTYWIPLSRTGNKLQFFDGGFVDPYNLPQRGFLALARPGSPEERVGRLGKELASTFLGPEIASTTVAESLFNFKAGNIPLLSDERGRVRDADSLKSLQLRDTALHAWKGLRPGGATTLDRLGYDPVANLLRSRAQREREPTEEAIALVGPRIRTVDIGEGLIRKAGNFREALGSVGRNYTNRMRYAKTDSQINDAKDIATREFDGHYETLVGYLSDAKTWGMSKREARKLTKGIVSDYIFNHAWAGRDLNYRKYKRSNGEDF